MWPRLLSVRQQGRRVVHRTRQIRQLADQTDQGQRAGPVNPADRWVRSRLHIGQNAGSARPLTLRCSMCWQAWHCHAGPDGTEVPNRGLYLDVVPNERLVFTDAYTSAWQPSAKPFFTCVLTFEDEYGKTRYTARAKHWTAEDCASHDQMGFHEGWGVATDQLAALAATL